MRTSPDIPRERRERNPLITPQGYARLCALRDHPAAPAWNYEVGDRLHRDDLPAVAAYATTLRRPRAGRPPADLLTRLAALRPVVPHFRTVLPEGFALARDWDYVPTMRREDLARHLEDFVPLDVDLSRLIVYDTSGVTDALAIIIYGRRRLTLTAALYALLFVLACQGLREWIALLPS